MLPQLPVNKKEGTGHFNLLDVAKTGSVMSNSTKDINLSKILSIFSYIGSKTRNLKI